MKSWLLYANCSILTATMRGRYLDLFATRYPLALQHRIRVRIWRWRCAVCCLLLYPQSFLHLASIPPTFPPLHRAIWNSNNRASSSQSPPSKSAVLHSHRWIRPSSILFASPVLILHPSSSGETSPAKLLAKQCLQSMLGVFLSGKLAGFVGLEHWKALADDILDSRLRKLSPIFCIIFSILANKKNDCDCESSLPWSDMQMTQCVKVHLQV